MNWRQYHELTKHTPQSLRQTRHFLDWANMPDPFRHYEGVPLLDLAADPPPPEIPALALLQGAASAATTANGPAFLSQLLFHCAAISASKQVPSTGYRYALRVNPSSGNLHPTEFHFISRGLRDWPDGLYHYRPSSHMAEQRATGDFSTKFACDSAAIVFILTSIVWREAWKYRDRAYRYCLHDMGHAWQALTLAARAAGFDSFAVGHFADDEVAQRCRLNPDEWPMLIVKLQAKALPVRETDGGEAVWFDGQANRLSDHQVDYPLIDEMHNATKLNAGEPHRAPADEPSGDDLDAGGIKLPSPANSTRAFGEVARLRRSALDFEGGARAITIAQLSAILAAASHPLGADFSGTSFVWLYLYVHRVHGLETGVYRYWPRHSEVELIRSGDQRVQAAGLSLGQDLAGNACVAFSMVADLERAARLHGDRGYRYAHFEAGAIGHRLYLAAEALGLGATGIGAFFDDEVHHYLNLASGQVIYHFAIGYPIPDPRLGA